MFKSFATHVKKMVEKGVSFAKKVAEHAYSKKIASYVSILKELYRIWRFISWIFDNLF
jgi:hypothetical protein